MKEQSSILIIIWSVLLAAVTLANAPSGNPGATFGALFSNNAGNIGIKTFAPTTMLDINGTTIIRKSLDMANNRIINVLAPTSSTDAVNKAYADAQTGNMASSTTGLWGEGRPGATVLASLGECTSTIASTIIKVSRSGNTATWDGARAACPANWWVCSAAERGTAACGLSNRPTLFCDPLAADNNELYHWVGNAVELTSNWGWISDAASTDDRKAKTASIGSGANTAEQYACNIAPIWCCSY